MAASGFRKHSLFAISSHTVPRSGLRLFTIFSYMISCAFSPRSRCFAVFSGSHMLLALASVRFLQPSRTHGYLCIVLSFTVSSCTPAFGSLGLLVLFSHGCFCALLFAVFSGMVALAVWQCPLLRNPLIHGHLAALSSLTVAFSSAHVFAIFSRMVPLTVPDSPQPSLSLSSSTWYFWQRPLHGLLAHSCFGQCPLIHGLLLAAPSLRSPPGHSRFWQRPLLCSLLHTVVCGRSPSAAPSFAVFSYIVAIGSTLHALGFFRPTQDGSSYIKNMLFSR